MDHALAELPGPECETTSSHSPSNHRGTHSSAAVERIYFAYHV